MYLVYQNKGYFLILPILNAERDVFQNKIASRKPNIAANTQTNWLKNQHWYLTLILSALQCTKRDQAAVSLAGSQQCKKMAVMAEWFCKISWALFHFVCRNHNFREVLSQQNHGFCSRGRHHSSSWFWSEVTWQWHFDCVSLCLIWQVVLRSSVIVRSSLLGL